VPDQPDGTRVIVAAPRKAMKVFDTGTISTVLAQGYAETYDVFASAGTVATVKLIYAMVTAASDSFAAGGTTLLNVNYQDTNATFMGQALQAISTYNSQILLENSIIRTADDTQYPTTEAAQSQAVNSITFDDSIGLLILLRNSTDHDYSSDRRFVIVYEEEQVSS